ncbi:broad-complex core protein isoforms 1/2/3/4/5-like isoform X2 [Cloeon dipterum]|uniref:broad-complex core protein isoforms 1/2/3/4/5-like isoform X2 n=1 Tax=Cloeon dipterum TaxID=197152 RepID=UPI0032206BB1
MVDTQHFCLRWNNYQSSITSAFENLRDDEDFVDVTLACEGKSLKAHRVVLSACSPYFRELLKSTPCAHPVIVLQDVAFADLHALVEFIYHGEVNVHQRSLTSFLKTAEVLRVSGLTQQAEERDELGVAGAGITAPRNLAYPEKLEDTRFPSPITASPVGSALAANGNGAAAALLRRPPPIRRDSEQAGLGGEYDLSMLSKRAKLNNDEASHNSSVVAAAAAATMLQQAAVVAAAAAASQQTSPEDFSPKSRRGGPEMHENNHQHTPDLDRKSPKNDMLAKQELCEAVGPNIDVDNDDSMEGKAPSSVASDQAETDGSTQGGPPGHFNMQEKLHSLFSASSPGQPFNFNLPVSRQALSEAASLSSLANAAGLNQSLPELGLSPGFVLPMRGLGYRCEPCGKNLTSPQRLRRHIQNVHAKPVKPPVCNICNKVYSTLNSLRNHKSIYHRALQRRTLASSNEFAPAQTSPQWKREPAPVATAASDFSAS